MKRDMTARLMWQLRMASHRLQWPLAAAITFVIAISGSCAAMLWPLYASVSDLTERVAQIPQQTGGQSSITLLASPSEQLETFYAFFPTEKAVPEVLERLFDAATRENLSLPQGDYQVAQQRIGRLLRIDFSLPVKGNYPSLRRFIAQAMKETPALALTAITFSRPAAAEMGVDAQVRLALYVQKAPTP